MTPTTTTTTTPITTPTTTEPLPIRRALLSVSDKRGVVDLARGLVERGAELLSTGGTASALRAAGLPVVEVSEHTGFPEILDGRVKTLVAQIHGGILARRDLPEHLAQLAAHGIAPIDLVVVNLYPFEATVASGADAAACLESIDIGGPALIRAAAKNFDRRGGADRPRAVRGVRARRHHAGGAARAGRGGVRPRRRLRRRDRDLVLRRVRAAGAPAAGGDPARDAALRREPAPGRGLLRHRRGAARGRDRAPGAGQGAVVQQPRRHRRGA